MLPFLQEQKLEDASDQKQPHRAGAAVDKDHADRHEQTQEQEYLTVAPQEKQVRKSTILLVVLFGIGLFSLWFMIKKSTPQTSLADSVGTEKARLEIAINQLSGAKSKMFKRMDEIVKKFYQFNDIQQVGVSELVKNPFKHDVFLGNLEEISEEFDAAPEIIRQQQLKQQTKNMQLLSIMKSDQGNCCMIDDRILYEGDWIKGLNVRQISDSFVKLESEGVEIILKLVE